MNCLNNREGNFRVVKHLGKENIGENRNLKVDEYQTVHVYGRNPKVVKHDHELFDLSTKNDVASH